MSDLPPDLPRLRALEAWLAGQAAPNETVATFLRLQLAAVRARIAEVEPAEPAGFVVQRMRTGPDRPLAYLHRSGCWVASGPVLGPEEARAALGRPGVLACDACRPEAG